jgi:hypothetical protein
MKKKSTAAVQRRLSKYILIDAADGNPSRVPKKGNVRDILRYQLWSEAKCSVEDEIKI